MLNSPDCQSCGAPTGATEFEALPCECDCGHRFEFSPPTGGSVRQPELKGFAMFKGGRWRTAMLERQAGGYMVLCACPKCSGPTKVPRSTSVSASCQHCHAKTEASISDHVVDVIPTARIIAQTWGGGMTLQWEPKHIVGSMQDPMDCPKCGGPVPAFEERHQCEHCKVGLLAFTSCGKRFIPGVQVVGYDEGNNIDEWRPLHDALDHYSKRLALAKDSGKVTRRAIGCGFGSVLLAFPLICVFMGIVIMISQADAEAGLSAGLIGFVLFGVVSFGGFVGAILYFMRRHKKKRQALIDE